MLGLGIQTEKDKFDLGDSIPFTLKLELPEVDEAASLSVLISGTNAEETRSSVMFCSPTIKKNVKKQDEVFYFRLRLTDEVSSERVCPESVLSLS